MGGSRTKIALITSVLSESEGVQIVVLIISGYANTIGQPV